jgi:hypothetical protein
MNFNMYFSQRLDLKSLSSGLIFGITLFRNNDPNVLKACVAEIGYAAAAMIAVAESIVSLVNYLRTLLFFLSFQLKLGRNHGSGSKAVYLLFRGQLLILF